MSARYVPVGWLPFKLVYDAMLVGAVGAYLVGYQWVGEHLASATLPIGIAVAVVLFGLHLLYQQQRAASLVLQPPAQASSA